MNWYPLLAVPGGLRYAEGLRIHPHPRPLDFLIDYEVS